MLIVGKLDYIWYNQNVVQQSISVPSSSIRIDGKALAILRGIARKQGQPQQTVLKNAIDSYRRDKFLEEANADFAILRSHPEAWTEEQQEREIWDRAIVVLPVTSKAKGIPFHVAVIPPEGGIPQPGFIKCEDVRAVSRGRLRERWGTVARIRWRLSKTGCGF